MRWLVIGFVFGTVGAFLWVLASVVGGVNAVADCLEGPYPTPAAGALDPFPERAECDDSIFQDPATGTMIVTGFTLMLGAPTLFWLIVPVALWLRRRTSRGAADERPGPA